MTTALAIAEPQAALEQVTHLLRSPHDWNEKRVAAMVADLSIPARQSWTLAHVAALLHPYYEKQTPQGIREIEAEDWAVALAGFPEWAIKAAIRWWKSDANEYRHRRPIEGDIVARIKVEMMAVRAADKMLKGGMRPLAEQKKDEPRISPERAAEIMKQAGFAPRRMQGE